MDPSNEAQIVDLQNNPLVARMRQLAQERTEPIRERGQHISKALDLVDEFLREGASLIPDGLQMDVAHTVVSLIQGAEIQRQLLQRDAVTIVSAIIQEVIRDTPINARFN